MFQVIRKNTETASTEIVASERRGAPLTREQAENLASRFAAAESRREIVYAVVAV